MECISVDYILGELTFYCIIQALCHKIYLHCIVKVAVYRLL